ncbi:transposase [Streptomyces stackebrandtii]|uniref:transposase n=1 Tax=Streptomyces stackebrandtii TaxID=3051177 RepID=UPI0037D99876
MPALLQQLKAACEAAEEAFLHQHEDAETFLSFPGLGPQLCARVLAELGADRARFTGACGLKAYAGSSPITRASGRKSSITRRRMKNQRAEPRQLPVGHLRASLLARRHGPVPLPARHPRKSGTPPHCATSSTAS